MGSLSSKTALVTGASRGIGRATAQTLAILVEHWDEIQDEATEERSKSKAPMFGKSFPTYA